MISISTHVLDTALGRPAVNLALALAHWDDAAWMLLRQMQTDDDGRARMLLHEGSGTFRLRFETGAYFDELNQKCFHPYVDIVFLVEERATHYHIPLLLTAHGYTTYRGT